MPILSIANKIRRPSSFILLPIVNLLLISDKLKILERLLELGFNLNEGDQFGWTPLFFAASKGRNKCA